MSNGSNESALGSAIFVDEKETVSQLLKAIKQQNIHNHREIFNLALGQVINLVMKNKSWTENAVMFCRWLLEHGVELHHRFTLRRGLFDVDSLFEL